MSNKCVMIATWEMAFNGLQNQYEDLCNGSKSIDECILDAVNDVENNPGFRSVGYGGLPNIDCKVQLDASYMQGDTLKVGALASLEGFANPVNIAYQLKDEQFNSFLVGTGANIYATKHGFEQKDMLTEESIKDYEERKRLVEEEDLSPYSGHDTVCILGKSNEGSISVGTSTSGLFMKENGRVGDSPLSGSGFYANSEYGACAATGLGEDIMKTCVSYEAVRLIEDGNTAQQAADLAIAKAQSSLLRRYGKCGDISIVTCDKDGNFGSATTTEEFSYVAFNQDTKPTIFLVTNKGEHSAASKEWIDNYFSAREKKFEE